MEASPGHAGSLGKRPSGIGSTQSEEELREKVRGRLVQALELAAKEGAAGDVAGAEGGEAARGDPSQVAAAVEGALLQLCGTGLDAEVWPGCRRGQHRMGKGGSEMRRRSAAFDLRCIGPEHRRDVQAVQ